MSHQLTASIQAAVTVALFLIAGVVGGFAILQLWDPPSGMFFDGIWRIGLESIDPLMIDATEAESVFSGTAWFVVFGLAAGLLIGLISAFLLARAELVTLAAVVVGGLIGGYVMYRVALWQAPPAPSSRADQADGVVASGTLELASPWLSLVPVTGGLIALAVVFLILAPHTEETLAAEASDGRAGEADEVGRR